MNIVCTIATLYALSAPAAGVRASQRDKPATDVFADMDGGATISEAAQRGRKTWILWTAGNEQFWDAAAAASGGIFELLKTLDSRRRSRRLEEFGLMNQPGFREARKPDRYGLWIDEGAELEGVDPKIYGRSTGVMGFRLYPNPNFTGEAVRRWEAGRDPTTGEARAFYEDSLFAAQPALVRPYRVGVSCGACHIAYHPCHPPAHPNEPEYGHLASAVGNQYLREGAVFAPNLRPGSFLAELLAAQPRGTSDTSRIATDHINNPGAINAILRLAERELIPQAETIAGGAHVRVPLLLKDGADSIGLGAAVLRVYVNTGLDHHDWLQRMDPLFGLHPQRPFEIAEARRHSAYWRATEERLADVAEFLRSVPAYPLAEAVEGGRNVGAQYITRDAALLRKGQLAFARACARCHSSRQPPDGEADPEGWFAAQVVQARFAEGNFFSDDRRHPVTEIKTNVARACGTNALAGHIWDNFSSQTYKELPSVGAVTVWNPYTEAEEPFVIGGGGRGYYRTPSLVSVWSSAPFLHNNALGEESTDPSVAGRLRAFEDAIEKLLWPEKRPGPAAIRRTAQESTLRLPVALIPEAVRRELGTLRPVEAGEYLELGPIPAGTPVDLIANLDPEADPRDFAALLVQWKAVRTELQRAAPAAEARPELMKTRLAPVLWKLSKCPDLVPDRGHYYGTRLPDEEKRALIAYLKTI